MLYDVWLTMDDSRVCPECAGLQSQRWPAASSHPQPPAHPGCRCMLIQELIEDPPPMPPLPPIIPILPPDEDEEEEDKDKVKAQSASTSTSPLTLTSASAFSASARPRTYAVTLIAAGELTGHRVTLPLAVLQRDWPIFAAPNLTAFADHPDFFGSPKIDRILGVYRNVRLEGDKVAAELELSPTPIATALQPLLDQAATDPAHAPNIGLSANVWATLEDDTDDVGAGSPRPNRTRAIARLTAAESVDVVFRPASAPARITQILAAAAPCNLEPGTLNQKGPAPMPEETLTPAIIPAPPNPDEYLSRLAGATLTMALREANLPAASEAAIREQFTGQTPSAAQIDAAIVQQRQLISALSFQITGHDHPLDQGRVTGMTTNLDEAQKIVNWMFGVAGAPIPPPSLRRPADIYGAITGDYEWHAVFTPARMLFASANATTLADLATNAMNKVIIQAWDGLSEYRWFEPLVTVQPHDGSTQDMAWISTGGIANLPVVAEGAAYTELSIADSKESDSFVKYGGYVGVTQEMLRKSEIARIQAVPRALAVAAVRTRSAAIAGIFTANSGVGPTLDDDSTALFHSNHGSNVQTTAFDITAWKAARIECYKHTEAGSSKRLGFWPKYCLVPGDLFDTALIAFGYGSGPGGYPGTANNDVNPYAVARVNDPRALPVAVPDWTDTGDWAYLVDPNQHPVLQMSYVQAPGGGTHPAPEIYSVSTPTAGLTFTNDVLPIKVRDWFAYGVSTWRGIGKRNVG